MRPAEHLPRREEIITVEGEEHSTFQIAQSLGYHDESQKSLKLVTRNRTRMNQQKKQDPA
jgi:hypothetical protein